jgi:hypothetical protein
MFGLGGLPSTSAATKIDQGGEGEWRGRTVTTDVWPCVSGGKDKLVF